MDESVFDFNIEPLHFAGNSSVVDDLKIIGLNLALVGDYIEYVVAVLSHYIDGF